MTPEHDDLLRRYLLGTLPPAAREDIERRLFTEDQLFWERLGLEEDELIDARVSGALDDEEAEAFDRNFLCSDERRAKLAFARAVQHQALARSVPRRAWDWLRLPLAAPRWAVAAAALALAVLPGVVWQSASRRAAATDLSATLSSGIVRDAAGRLPRLTVTADCRLARLELVTGPERYEHYAATLHEVDGGALWTQHQLGSAVRGEARVVLVVVPCQLLPEGDYWIRLQGIRQDGAPAQLDRYDFRVLQHD
jgi:hypothetical protein